VKKTMTRRDVLARLGLAAGATAAPISTSAPQSLKERGIRDLIEEPRVGATITLTEEEFAGFVRQLLENAEYYSSHAVRNHSGMIEWLRERGHPLRTENKKFIAAWSFLGVTV
jgi:hypothetical protein